MFLIDKLLIDIDNSEESSRNNSNPLESAGLFEGDIQLAETFVRNAAASATKRWPNAQIPYVISIDYS